MAEGQEKTEQATPRRRQDARRKGQVARSPELSGAFVLLVTLLTLQATLRETDLLSYLHTALATFHEHLEMSRGQPQGQSEAAARVGREALLMVGRVVLLPLGAGCAAAIVAGMAQVGFLWTTQPLVPDFNRINPASGLTRLLGLHGLVEAAKAIVKMIVVGWVVYATVHARLPELVALNMLPVQILLPLLGGLLYTLTLRVTLVFFGIAVFDYAYKRWDFEKGLRMSKQEIKQEHKQTEGDPLLKQAIRQRQRDAAKKRMMQDVPKADVVITNPTHFAIALAYDADTMNAPSVLAKGQDEIAARIREIATAEGVPLMENPPLARTLYQQVEVGKPVPPALYAAVAQVLAYVYERNQHRAARRPATKPGTSARRR